MSIYKPSDIDTIAYNKQVDFLFGFLDYNRAKSASKSDIANLLIMLSGGDRAQKINASYAYYDRKGGDNIDIR